MRITIATYLNRSSTRLPYISEEVIAGLETSRKRVDSGGISDRTKTDGGKGDSPISKEPDALPSLRPLQVVVLYKVFAGCGEIVCDCAVVLRVQSI